MGSNKCKLSMLSKMNIWTRHWQNYGRLVTASAGLNDLVTTIHVAAFYTLFTEARGFAAAQAKRV